MLNIENGDDAIYPEAHVTKAQSILLLVAFLLKHKLTDTALTDLLDILNLFLPNAFPRSKYMFYKTIHLDNPIVSGEYAFKILLEIPTLQISCTFMEKSQKTAGSLLAKHFVTLHRYFCYLICYLCPNAHNQFW